nr:MAG TPA: hypothetical protein [Caudoviricetes sp.]
MLLASDLTLTKVTNAAIAAGDTIKLPSDIRAGKSATPLT